MVLGTSDRGYDNEDSDDYLLGVTTADNRIRARDLHERKQQEFDIDSYIDRNYGRNVNNDFVDIPTLEEREYNAMYRLRSRKRQGIVVPSIPISRIPQSKQDLYARQQYIESKKAYARAVKNKRASVPNMPVVDLDVPTNNGKSVKQVRAFQLTNPYDPIRQFLFEDCFRSDPVAKRCVLGETDIVMGTRAYAMLDIDREFTTEEIANGTKREQMESVLENDTMSMLQTEFNEIDKQVRMRSKMRAMLVQSSVGGRAALEKVSLDADGIPTDLKILNWKKMGDIYIDVDTWQIVAIAYADREENDPLTPDQIIYHSRHDYHVSPDSLYYGLSDMETIAATSEINRLLDEVDLKETAKTQWSKTGAVKFPADTSPEVIRNYMASLTPGSMNGTDIDVTFDLWDLESNLERLVALRLENDRRIIRAFGNPMVTIGFEEITNHATVNKVFTWYEQSTIKERRTWLQDIYEPQWYAPILMKLAPGLIKPVSKDTPGIRSLSTETALKMAAVRAGPDSDIGKSAKAKFDVSVIKRRQAERRARKPEIKIKLEFESIGIEALSEKMPVLLQMHDKSLLTTKGLLKQANMPQEIEEVEKLKEEAMKKEEQMHKEEIDLSKQAIDVGIRRQKMMEQRQAQSQVKRASLSDDISMNYRTQSVLNETQIANANREHAKRISLLDKRDRVISTVDERIQQILRTGGVLGS